MMRKSHLPVPPAIDRYPDQGFQEITRRFRLGEGLERLESTVVVGPRACVPHVGT